MPFHVKVQDQVIEDIGTSFNIKAYSEENETKTTLLEGSVKIIKSGKEKTLQPGEQGRVNNNVNEILIIKDVNLKAVIAWKNGEMSLTNSSVQQIMQEISRWYDVDIKYAGSIPVKKFFGSIDRNVPLSLVLEGLKSYGVETKLEGKTIIVQ
jgi:ferric-dicitrate binding protein FerR (iron transport regulator)